MNPYQDFVARFARMVEEGREYPLGDFPRLDRSPLPNNAPKALFFAPHPDDECISGGLAVRLLREAGMNVMNVAITLGRKEERKAERLRELEAACQYMGFGLLTTGPKGLDGIHVKTREEEPRRWAANVKVIHRILDEHQPRVLLFPHAQDWNSTHIGTHHLVMDALKKMPRTYECFLAETEFWGQMMHPNLMVELSEQDVTEMITGTSFHAGEVKRNPYHLLLPAWLMDNVRRGSELVGGQGGAAADFTYAALYRFLKWHSGKAVKVFDAGKMLGRNQSPSELFQ